MLTTWRPSIYGINADQSRALEQEQKAAKEGRTHQTIPDNS